MWLAQFSGDMEERGTPTSFQKTAVPPLLRRGRIGLSDLVSRGRALQNQIKQLWLEDWTLTDGVGTFSLSFSLSATQVINAKKISWCLVVSSGVICICLMLLTVLIGRSLASSCGSSSSHKTELCPEKQGFFAGSPCRGECGGTQGCRTINSSECSKKCSENLNCRVWTFSVRQNHCLLRRGDSLVFSHSTKDVWGFSCRSTGKP